VALATLIAMEVVLGIDNLIFISILTNSFPSISASARGGSTLVLSSSCGWACWERSPGLSS